MKAAGKRQKGSRGEREIVAALHGKRIRGRTLTARRVPLSGAAPGFKGDVLVGEQCSDSHLHRIGEALSAIGVCAVCSGTGVLPGSEEQIEVKRRAQGFKKIDEWLDDAFAVVYRRDRGEWIITMRLKDLVEE